jgi:hypothetical protein
MTKLERLEIFEEGFHAFRIGENQNPYSKEYDEHYYYWNRGYNEADSLAKEEIMCEME